MAFTLTTTSVAVRDDTSTPWFHEADNDARTAFLAWRDTNYIYTNKTSAWSATEFADETTLTSVRQFVDRDGINAWLAESNVKTQMAARKVYEDANGITRTGTRMLLGSYLAFSG